MNTSKIGFIGGGNMASSLINGLCQSGHKPENIWVSDINANVLTTLNSSLNVNTLTDNIELLNNVDVVVLAVKPQVLKQVALTLASALSQKPILVISIAAGISQASLSHWLGESLAIVRCMPNTPALVLTGATALHANSNVTATQRDLAENIMRAVGIALWVEQESALDAVTALSGSGPAYFFLMMEAMENAALSFGLSHDIARLLIQQTALGAAKIALESEESPEQLRFRVTSPGGTTEQAIAAFQQGGFNELVGTALTAAK
ncbi:pyrroline-5-carboxylate reductase [Methylocucumis oryzae]|uniref:Pyrroline-5-carboxylate reductase n=1 Tax=Methylocucumis oryzae TaxID=1632867 RepID=A0A0F3ILI9_9GAMM|nr:pyrroline-5-carboxylate reductase [Methylocucumis oryzae]